LGNDEAAIDLTGTRHQGTNGVKSVAGFLETRNRLPDEERVMRKPSMQFWIVDDDLQFGKSLRRMLNSRGIPAEYFGSAQTFLDSVPPEQSGYAIVDIQMPVCDGFGLIKKMRELDYGMPVIIITGNVYSHARDYAMQNGAIGFLQKPFSEESLLEFVHKQELEGSVLEP
jgi:FixJ family two-component response regulator